jgi:CxxC motif-containing protein
VDIDEGKVASVTGNSCKRGAEYAKSECTNPTRVLTTTVRVNDGDITMLPVKSEKALPKGLLFECMKVINQHSLRAPVKIGDVVIENILDTGVNIIAARNVGER